MYSSSSIGLQCAPIRRAPPFIAVLTLSILSICCSMAHLQLCAVSGVNNDKDLLVILAEMQIPLMTVLKGNTAFTWCHHDTDGKYHY